jgi:Glycosyl hydrolase family 48/Cellulose binding domain
MVTRAVPMQRWRPFAAYLAVIALVAGLVASSPALAQSASCAVDYTVQNQWPGGFTANVTITNTGPAINGWTLTWTFPDNQQITQAWNATVDNPGPNATVTNATWNATIPTNGTATFGFNGTGNVTPPTTFTLNTTTCGGDPGEPTEEPTEDPTGGPTEEPTPPGDPGEYGERFLELYEEIKDPANGYFSPDGVPYHAVETLIVEAPDHGHQTTSEAFSYWLWLEANYGRVTGDWQPLNDAWAEMEESIIPNSSQQPSTGGYNPADPATYAPEWPQPDNYPTPLDDTVTVGQDPLFNELRSTYGTNEIYGMHWLLDVDNVYGFGECGDGTTTPAYINTFQRGEQESVWETVPHPSCETFAFGGPNGYLDLFIDDAQYAQQWRYTNAPDADARAVQAAYWALEWATAQGNAGAVSDVVADAARMGDYLRYAFFDKYFKQMGCTSPSCPAGTGKNSAHYLLNWYYAWGGALDGSWSWRIGSSHTHGGYQNPLAAWALANVEQLQPRSPTAVSDWEISFDRQMEFYRWLQSAEGAIAGGATNSWGGAYQQPPAGTPTFYGMFYDEDPVYHDPPSNRWFGFQAWTMERVAELLYVTDNADARALMDRWVEWALSETTVNADGTFQFPNELAWSGAPDTWNPSSPGDNSDLHVSVTNHTNDVGVAAAYVKTLLYYAAATGDTQAHDVAKAILDGMWNNNRDTDGSGIVVAETREDYERFDDPVYIPPGWSGTMPNGDPINSDSTFLSIRSFYENDPMFDEVEAYLNGGPAPTFEYHRFWAQTDIAMAMSTYDELFGSAE